MSLSESFFSRPDGQNTSSKIAFTWLLHLRWGAVICQIIIIFFAGLAFEIEIPFSIVILVIGFEAASNIGFSIAEKKRPYISQWFFAILMYLDVVLVTALLYYTGGPMNPFTFIYLIHVVLGTLLMNYAMSWGLAVFTVFCYAVFFFVPPSSDLSNLTAVEGQPVCVDVLNLQLATNHMGMHLEGMWFAFSITAFFIVFFVGKIKKSLERHQDTLHSLQEEKNKNERLASLATLAAGAAHEFSTPLSTIAIAAGEMLYALKEQSISAEIIEDVKLIQSQVSNCKEILYNMAADAGEHLGEPLEEVSLRHYLYNIVESFNKYEEPIIRVVGEFPDIHVKLPVRTLARTVKGLLKNSLDANVAGKPIEFSANIADNILCFIVKDYGSGITAEIVDKVTEPFFTTKKEGNGLGLGLFLAKSVAERFDGSLEIESVAGSGTTVTFSISINRLI